jgi:hypothetical protein
MSQRVGPGPSAGPDRNDGAPRHAGGVPEEPSARPAHRGYGGEDADRGERTGRRQARRRGAVGGADVDDHDPKVGDAPLVEDSGQAGSTWRSSLRTGITTVTRRRTSGRTAGGRRSRTMFTAACRAPASEAPASRRTR